MDLQRIFLREHHIQNATNPCRNEPLRDFFVKTSLCSAIKFHEPLLPRLVELIYHQPTILPTPKLRIVQP